MAEASEVRLVRCPKCQNVLPELPDFSVYQCGGCGAVLRAKKKKPAASDGLSERGRVGSENYESFLEEGGVSLGSASEMEGGSDGIEDRGIKKDRVFTERTVDLTSSRSSLRTQNREVVSNYKGETMGTRLDQEVGFGDKYNYRPSSKNPIHNWGGSRNDHDMNLSELVDSGVEKELGEIIPQMGNAIAAGSMRSRLITDRWGVERDGIGAIRRNSRAVAEQGIFSTFPYSDEGTLDYHPGSFHCYGELIKSRGDLDGANRVEGLEQDRAELLRKLDELRDQLSRSCDVPEKPRKKVPVDRRTALPDPYSGLEEDPSRLNGVPIKPLARDKHVPKPPYFNRSHGAVPFMNMPNFYPPPRHGPNEIPGYEDPFRPQIPRRPPHQPLRQYPQRLSHGYFSGQYMDFNQDPLASYPHETFFHHPACSCLRCYNKNWQVPPQVPPTVLGDRRFPNDETNPISYHHVNRVTYGPWGYNSRGANPPQLHSRDSQPHARRPSDLDSDIGGFGQRRPGRVVVAHGNGQRCHPIAGGAPFITCYKCFELLKLPRKLMVMEKNQQKLRCGACSTIIVFEVENKRLIVSFPAQNKPFFAEVEDSSGEVLNKNLLRSHGCSNAGGTNSSADDCDNSGYNFQSTDTEPNLPSEDQRLNLNESEKGQGHLSSSSGSSEDEQSPDSVIVRGDVSNSAEPPSRDDVSPPHLGSPLREHVDCSSDNHAMSRYGKGNKSKCTDQEKVILSKSTSRQNSVKDASVATEMDVSFNEYLNSGVSQDSMEVSKEEDQPRINKGSESFFAGLIKKSFRDFSRSSQSVENGRSNVSVNGQPIPDHVVKKAEKIAGPIHPGEYWYDSRAGFWGVMGQPCLGIIPPFIEEFNFLMPENCAGGNTGIFVNGRELHPKDLDLLTSRGLPNTRDKSYIVEISGRVLDEDSGEEVDSLGKLAPTVERVKHGFGMRVPRVVM